MSWVDSEASEAKILKFFGRNPLKWVVNSPLRSRASQPGCRRRKYCQYFPAFMSRYIKLYRISAKFQPQFNINLVIETCENWISMKNLWIWMHCHDVISSRELENHLGVLQASPRHPEGFLGSKKVENHCLGGPKEWTGGNNIEIRHKAYSNALSNWEMILVGLSRCFSFRCSSLLVSLKSRFGHVPWKRSIVVIPIRNESGVLQDQICRIHCTDCFL